MSQYPINMQLVNGIGFAVANDEDEHKDLTDKGYGPAFVPAPEAAGGKKKAAE